MCGLVGFIGESKNKENSFFLISSLLRESESRGIDATGYWACEKGKEGKIFYHKLPYTSSEYILSNHWTKLTNIDLDLLLGHARGASRGVGEPTDNKNNHPFVSEDKMLALIHNGRITDSEYNFSKPRFKLSSNCDSEIILRTIEDFDDLSNKEIIDLNDYCDLNQKRLIGINQVFDLFPCGHMAVALAERRENEKFLWLFRNENRPLWIFDATKSLGQIFFASEETIWTKSHEETEKSFNVKIEFQALEVKPYDIWYFEKTNDKPDIKIKIFEKEKVFVGIQSLFCKAKRKKTEPCCEVVSELNY